MTSSELAGVHHSPEQNSECLNAQAEACEAFTNERVNLNDSIDTSFLALPEHAQNYLRDNCDTPTHRSLAAQKVTLLLEENPNILDDPFEAELELDDCIKASEITALDKNIETEKVEGKKLDTTIEVLRNEVAEAVQGKNSFEQLTKAKTIITEKEMDKTHRAELMAWLDGIEATATQVTALAKTPEEQVELQRIFASTSFDLTAETMAGTFSSFVIQAEASGVLSEDSKDQIAQKLEYTRWEEPKTATQMFNQIDAVRDNEGQFYNPKTKRLENFTPDNGLPLGKYTVFPDPQSSQDFTAMTEVGGRKLRLHFNRDTDPNLVDELVSTAMIAQRLANRDLQAASRYILGGDGLAAQGYTDIRLDEYQTKRAEQLYGAFMGSGTELRTGFPTQTELTEFERRLQATHIDGDAKTGDNTGRGDLSWEQIGMIDNNGTVNMSAVEAVGTYINGQDRTSLPSYSELVAEFGHQE